MTRVSTFAANQNALMDLMKAQKSLFDAQKQLTTGKLATDLKGVGHQAETLSATRAALQRARLEDAGQAPLVRRPPEQHVVLQAPREDPRALRGGERRG